MSGEKEVERSYSNKEVVAKLRRLADSLEGDSRPVYYRPLHLVIPFLVRVRQVILLAVASLRPLAYGCHTKSLDEQRGEYISANP